MTELKIAPEALTICDTYLACGQDTQKTADHLGLSKEVVSTHLNKRECRAYVDRQFLEAGWLNRDKISSLFDKLIEDKLTQMQEDEMTTDADILDILKVLMKFRQDEMQMQLKLAEPAKQTNIQVNNNYTDIMSKVLNGK